MAQSSGLTQRGLLLLGLMVAIVVAVWAIFLRTPRQAVPPERPRAEPLIGLLLSPGAPFPATISWAAAGQLAEALPSARGWEIRYTAAITLARRGSANVPFDTLSEMLDEQRQMANRPVKLKDGRVVPDEAAARQTVLAALKAVTEWHKHTDAVKQVGSDNPGLKRVYGGINRLTRSDNLVVRKEAESVRIQLGLAK
jgi:hypothetical protein